MNGEIRILENPELWIPCDVFGLGMWISAGLWHGFNTLIDNYFLYFLFLKGS